MKSEKGFIDEARVHETLRRSEQADAAEVRDVLVEARSLGGLCSEKMATLMSVRDPELLRELFDTARWVKERIYGRRLVIFAPLYISNLCRNECAYCAFRARNKAIARRALTQEEIRRETLTLVDQGHKRVLLVAGEAYPKEGFSYVLDAIDTIYSTRHENGEIRRINVNVAPLEVEQFAALKSKGIGTYQVFQETYHRETYRRVHLGGRKTDYDWRVWAMDRAMQGGIDDVGIGVLFGLADWRFELLALKQHIEHLEDRFGTGPHTISVPRLEPATGSEISYDPPCPVSDMDFRKIIAITRLAVPYTGIIMSTRESKETRRETFGLGVSQISAGSRTNPGGYSEGEEMPTEDDGQFSLGDHRPLDEVIRDVASLGHVPSFCTGCYRLGRTGSDFMDLAKPGEIRCHCDPNAASTFEEYLLDYASDDTRRVGEDCIESYISRMEDRPARISRRMVAKVRQGLRDVYC